MMGGFPRVVASGVLLLLAATTTTLVHLAVAYSSELTDAPEAGSTTGGPTVATEPPTTTTGDGAGAATEPPTAFDGSFFSACGEESFACSSDAACSSCQEQDPDGSSAIPCGFNPLVTDEDDCDTNFDFACCLDDLSELECLENEAFAALWLCNVDRVGCSADEITCEGDESTTKTDSSAADLRPAPIVISVFSAFMGLLPILWARPMP